MTIPLTLIAIAKAVTPLRTQPSALPLALDPPMCPYQAIGVRGAPPQILGSQPRPRADRQRWRAAVLAVATAVAPRRTRPMALPEAWTPP